MHSIIEISCLKGIEREEHMSEYKRMISYLYKYERGHKGENVGYVRLDVRKGVLKVSIHIQDNKALKDTEFPVYFYYRDGEKLRGIHGGSLRFYQGESEFKEETKEHSLFDSGHGFDEMGGLLLYYNKELAYGTEWDNRPILLHQFVEDNVEAKQVDHDVEEKLLEIEQKMDDIEQKEERDFRKQEDIEMDKRQIEESNRDNGKKEQKETVVEETIKRESHRNSEETTFFELGGLSIDQETIRELQAIYQGSSIGKEQVTKKEAADKESIQKEQPIYQKVGNKELFELFPDRADGKKQEEENNTKQLFETLVKNCPKINDVTNDELRNLVRIHPQDIGKLAISNWHFGSNSFVIHGYYQHHYLVIGTQLLENGKEQPILGVPGVYSNQDQYMAFLFGFKQFIPRKPTQIKTGAFGYWIANLIE